MIPADDEILWAVRAFVYDWFAESTRPPDAGETAARFGLTLDEARAAYRELDRRHALYLEPGTCDIRFANPFSAVPTAFRVHTHGRSYWANCAWDALGIPAALHADAVIDAELAWSGQPLTLAVEDGRVRGGPAVAHFLVPFHRWYQDLTFT